MHRMITGRDGPQPPRKRTAYDAKFAPGGSGPKKVRADAIANQALARPAPPAADGPSLALARYRFKANLFFEAGDAATAGYQSPTWWA